MTRPRPLCAPLAAAIDAMTPTERRVLVKAAQEDQGRAPWLTRLLGGLVVQASADAFRREQETAAVLAEYEAENLREIDDIAERAFGPLPQRTEGEDWWPEG